MRITLKTLPQATAQEVFDQVARHMLKQNARSLLGKNACAYRGKGGMMCAAGCLMADDEYDNKLMEGRSWQGLATTGVVPHEHHGLIGQLQYIHDQSDPGDWPHLLKKCAERHEVTMPGAE